MIYLSTRRRGSLTLGLAVCCTLGLVLAPAHAQAPATQAQPPRADAAQQDRTSLDLVPADAASYAGAFRLSEQWQTLTNTQGWERLTNLELWQAIRQNPQVQGALQAWEGDAFQQYRPLLTDLVDDEVFYYVAGDWQQLSQLQVNYQQQQVLNFLKQLQQGQAMRGQDQPAARDQQQRLREFVKVAAEDPKLLSVPTIVLGAKVSEGKSFQQQFDQLQPLLAQLLQNLPEGAIAEPLKKAQVADSSYLQVGFKASALIDLSEVEPKQGELTQQQIQAVEQRVDELTILLNLGVWNDEYLLFSLGPDTKHLQQFGQGDSLAGTEALQPLREESGRGLTSATYASGEFRKSVNQGGSAQSQFERFYQFWQLANQTLQQSDIDPQLQQELTADLQKLGKLMFPSEAQIGPYIAWTFQSPEGYETYQIEETNLQLLEGGKPLKLTSYLGGRPLAAGVIRPKAENTYEIIATLTNLGSKYYQNYGQQPEDPQQRKKFETLTKVLAQAEKPLAEITQQKLIPALGDVELGLALIPGSEIEVPVQGAGQVKVPELALILAIEDRQQFIAAMQAYRQEFNSVIEQLKEAAPAEKREQLTTIPAPQQAGGAGDQYDLFYYPLPEQAGQQVPGKLGLYLAVGNEAAVVTSSPAAAAAIFAGEKLQTPALKQEVSQAAASAGVVDFAQIVKQYRPLAEKTVQQQLSGLTQEQLPENITPEMVTEAAATSLELFDFYQGSTTVTTIEGNTVRSHTVHVLRDVQ